LKGQNDTGNTLEAQQNVKRFTKRLREVLQAEQFYYGEIDKEVSK